MTRTAALEPWNVSAHDFPADGETGEQLCFLLRHAVLAPSGHNTQPWLVVLHRNALELYADRRRRCPSSTPRTES